MLREYKKNKSQKNSSKKGKKERAKNTGPETWRTGLLRTRRKSNLVIRLDWRRDVSFSVVAEETTNLSIREVIFLRKTPSDLREMIWGSLTLTHLSLFLFPHCKKNSGSKLLQEALWFLSSFSISVTENKKQRPSQKLEPYKARNFEYNKNNPDMKIGWISKLWCIKWENQVYPEEETYRNGRIGLLEAKRKLNFESAHQGFA